MANPTKNDRSMRELLMRSGNVKPAPARVLDRNLSQQKAIEARKAEISKRQVAHA